MYTNLAAIGGFTTNGYWSTEQNDNNANIKKAINFVGGGTIVANSSDGYIYRAVRFF